MILSIAGLTGTGIASGSDLSAYVDRQAFDIEAAIGKRIDTSHFWLMDTLPSSMQVPDRAEVWIYDAAAGGAVTDPPWAISAYNTFKNGAGSEVTSLTPANWTPRLFAGYVATPEYTHDGPQRYIEVSCQDYTTRLRTTVTNMAFAAGNSDQTIINQLFARYRPDYNTANVSMITSSFPAITYPVHTIEQCMERIIKVSRGYYRADYYKQMWYGIVGQQLAPFNLSDIPDSGLPLFTNGGFETVDSVSLDAASGWGTANSQANSVSRRDELVQDPGFESGTLALMADAWTLTPDGTFLADTAAGNFHEGAVGLKDTRTVLSGWGSAITKPIPVSASQSYFCSGWFKQIAGSKQTHFKINWFQDAGATVASTIRGSDFVMGGTDGVQPWTQFSGTFTPPADAVSCKLNCMFGFWDGVTGTNAQVWFDDIRFRGPNSTPVHSGSHGYTVDCPTAAHYGALYSKQGVRVGVGELLNIAMWLKASTGGRSFGPVRLTFANPGSIINSAGQASGQPSNQAGTVTIDTSSFAPTAAWALYTAQVTVPAGYDWCFIELYANTNAFPTTFWIDDVSVSRTLPVFPTENLKYSPDGSGLANRVWVVGSTYLSTQQDYQVPPALVNGTTYQFPLPGNPEVTGMTITVAGVDQGKVGVSPGDGDTATPSGFKYNTLISHVPATVSFKTPPGSGQAVHVIGKFRYPLVQVVTDSGLIAATNGVIFEAVVRDKRINDSALAKAVGQAFLKNQGSTLKGGSCEIRTRQIGGRLLQPGHVITIKNDVLFRNILKDANGNPTTTAVVVVTQLKTDLDDDSSQPYKVTVSFADRNVSGGY